MHTDADVIIAGAGPAGSIAARELASQGIAVLILEKSVFPRSKICGGGLTDRVLREIPFDLSPVIEKTVHTIRFSCKFRETFTRQADKPLLHCTMRSRMDEFLLQKATQAGAKVICSAPVTGVHPETSGIRVITQAGSFAAKILIGADGASGRVAPVTGLRTNLSPGLAWEAEMETGAEDMAIFGHTVFLDWGTFPGGYGWIFPKLDHFSVGVGGPASLANRMIRYYEGFVTMSGIRFTGTRSLHSWPIPVKNKKDAFHNGRVMVVGDAAGLTDPLTGEGIYYAVRSGKYAALSALEYLAGTRPDVSAYTQRINSELMPVLLEANRIKDIFNVVPLTIHRLVSRRERVWAAFGKVLRGERTYLDVRPHLGRWKFIWPLICLMAHVTGPVKRIRGLP